MKKTSIQRLEGYTIKHPNEVLLVTAQIDEEMDQIAIYRGFSSSLMRPTAFDPDVPVLPENGEIITIDRLQGPYDPSQPRYLEQGLSWDVMAQRLDALGI